MAQFSFSVIGFVSLAYIYLFTIAFTDKIETYFSYPMNIYSKSIDMLFSKFTSIRFIEVAGYIMLPTDYIKLS